MHEPFEQGKTKAMEVPHLTDPLGKSILSCVLGIAGTSGAQTKFDEATHKRLGTPREQHEAAHIYLALGLLQLRVPGLTVQGGGETVPPTKLFHFAGHAFREIGQLNRAADAYWRAGVANGKEVDEFAIRSLARAKSCYAEIGETEKSDCMHRLEWEARRARAKWANWALLTAWRLTTAYGTSLGRWLGSLLVVLAGFSIIYEVLHTLGAIHDGHKWTPISSAAYFCIVTTATVGYGDFTPTNWIGELVVVTNVLLGYAMLVFGTTILGRKVLGR